MPHAFLKALGILEVIIFCLIWFLSKK